MAGSVFDSPLFAHLFPTGEIGRLFSDTAALRAMLLVEGALAKAQAAQGAIPEISAAAIQRAAMEIQVDPAALAKATGENGVSVPALVEAFRSEMKSPEHAQYVHWGATSQDIIDTGLILRLRQALALIETDVQSVLLRLAHLARSHAELPMPASTYGQHATPTSFGAVVAAWGAPILSMYQELAAIRAQNLFVSLSGAAGTSSALGPDPATLRAKLAEALDLGDPGRSWHTDRTPFLRIADWLTRLGLALGKIGEDVQTYVQSGRGNITLDGAGASSTMPQKANPVTAAILIASAHQAAGLNATLQGAAMHRDQRDGAAWFTEWMCLPQIVLGTAAAVKQAHKMLEGLNPDEEKIAASFDTLGLVHAEALSFALTTHMTRPDAQAATKTLCRQAIETNTSLKSLVAVAWPDLDIDTLFDPAQQIGNAAADAQRFADAVRSQFAGRA